MRCVVRVMWGDVEKCIHAYVGWRNVENCQLICCDGGLAESCRIKAVKKVNSLT